MQQSPMTGRKQKRARVRAHCKASETRFALIAKKVPGCGCTDGQACLHRCTDIARINPHEQEGDQPNCECGERLRECVST